MATKPSRLLCELHAHSTWSDGELGVRELCDLYGRSGFDVLAVTDHVCGGASGGLAERDHPRYLAEILAEAERARALYGLLVIPGLELTYDHEDPTRAAYAVAVGLAEFVDVADGIEIALAAARARGAALVAAHPYSPDELEGATRGTAAFAARPDELVPLVDRLELFNRQTLFRWVADAGLPVVASGDFHRPEHLTAWKTMLPCAKDAASVIGYLRSPRPAFLVSLDRPIDRLAA